MSLRCLFGFHDWERHGGEYVAPAWRPIEVLLDPRMIPRPAPTGYISERFEQCARCDKTQWGWTLRSEAPRAPPTPVARPAPLDRFGRPTR